MQAVVLDDNSKPPQFTGQVMYGTQQQVFSHPRGSNLHIV